MPMLAGASVTTVEKMTTVFVPSVNCTLTVAPLTLSVPMIKSVSTKEPLAFGAVMIVVPALERDAAANVPLR